MSVKVKRSKVTEVTVTASDITLRVRRHSDDTDVIVIEAFRGNGASPLYMALSDTDSAEFLQRVGEMY